VPNSVSIANVRRAFTPEGQVIDAGTEESLRGLAKALDTFMQHYVCPKYVMEAAVREGTLAAPWTTTV
jgi:hypothetical protein